MVENTLDLQELVGNQLEEAEPDVLREIIRSVVGLLMSTEADTACNAVYGERSEDRIKLPQRLPVPALGHARGNHRPEGPQAPLRLLFPRMVAAAPPSGREGVHRGYRRLLSRRGVDAPGRQARQDARDRGRLLPTGVQAG